MKKTGFTRGEGLLEGFLAKKRASQANVLISQEHRKGKLLDIGCGSYPYFLLNTDFKEKYGIDPSLKTLGIKDLNLKKQDVVKQKLPFRDSFFDAVTMLAVFEHIDADKLGKLLREIKRILKKDGVLVITTPAPWSDKLLHQMSKIGLISSEEIHEHKHHYNRHQTENLISEAGFKKSNVESGYFELKLNMWFIVRK